MNTKTIAIIGGGFAGTITAVHLLLQKSIPVHIILINTRYPLSKGVAYSSYSNKHLLNVPAKSMSAFIDKPDDFIKWIKNHENYGALDQNELPDMYLPRNIYGKYLKDTFENAIRNKSDNISIEFIHDEAIDLEIKDSQTIIYLSVSPPVRADKVLLAMGNHDPRDPVIQNGSLTTNARYFPNPWVYEAVRYDSGGGQVLIVGNGLTMVDVVIGLRENSYEGKIYSLSPHGFKILPHRKFEPYKDLIEEMNPPFNLEKLVSSFRKHIKIQRDKGLSGESVVDSLRPLTQKIWLSLNFKEKERFIYHLRHMWGVARHRLPMNVHKLIQQMILDDKLEIIAGTILSVEEMDSYSEVIIQRKNKFENLKIKAGRIINCTGPESDIKKMKSLLIQNLLASKLILPGELKMGIHATSEGSILQPDGKSSEHLFTIGSLLKGVLWESTAVPELRNQAYIMAQMLLGKRGIN